MNHLKGKSIEHACLVDHYGDTLITIPFDVPIEIPDGYEIQVTDIHLDVKLELRARTRRDDRSSS